MMKMLNNHLFVKLHHEIYKLLYDLASIVTFVKQNETWNET